MKGEFAVFVKENYEKVRSMPSKERLKALGEMYRGATEQRSAPAMRATPRRPARSMPAPAKRPTRPTAVVYKENLYLVPASVPVDRASTRGTNVPGPLRSGVATSNPLVQEIELRRLAQPKVMVQAEGTFIKQGGSKLPPTGTDLGTAMGLLGMQARNVGNMHGGILYPYIGV